MKKEILETMSEAELRAYASNLGIPAKALNAATDKAKFVESRWEKVVTVKVAGESFTIPTKVVKSKGFIDLMAKGEDVATEQALELLIGADGMKKVTDMATDEDGTVDVIAMGTIYGLILNDRKLKN